MIDDTLDYDTSADIEARKAKRINERLRAADGAKHREYGLCSKCRHFRILIRQNGAYLEKNAWCNDIPAKYETLTDQKPVKDCSAYWPVGAPTLREMMAEAKALEKRDLLKESYL